MKIIMVTLALVFLAGCSLSLEEYEARVRYCHDHGYKSKVISTVDGVVSVRCVGEGNISFNSKEK